MYSYFSTKKIIVFFLKKKNTLKYRAKLFDDIICFAGLFTIHGLFKNIISTSSNIKLYYSSDIKVVPYIQCIIILHWTGDLEMDGEEYGVGGGGDGMMRYFLLIECVV